MMSASESVLCLVLLVLVPITMNMVFLFLSSWAVQSHTHSTRSR